MDKLTLIVNNNHNRSVKALQECNILPLNTVYFLDVVSFYNDYPGQTRINKQIRFDARENWLKNAVNTLSECNIVFLDPDNGLEIPSIPNLNQKRSGKYAYYYEVNKFYENKDVCVIYHHLNHTCSHDKQIKFRLKELSEKVDKKSVIFALKFRPYSPRVFFIIAREEKVLELKNKIQTFITGSCGFGWSLYL